MENNNVKFYENEIRLYDNGAYSIKHHDRL